MGKVIKANPPKESVALVLFVAAICISYIPHSLKTIDEAASVEVISAPLFPEVISTKTLGYIRITVAVVFLLATLRRVTKKGHTMIPNYASKSKLKPLPINLDGIRSQGMFTSLSWNLLTVSFALNGLITLYAVDHNTNGLLHSIVTHKWVLRFAIIIFEIAAPTSMLVSSVVRYALWPQAIKGVNGSKGFRRTVALMQHNANVIASLMEVGVLGHIPVRISDLVCAPVWGCIYISFTWFMTHRWVESGEPQFVYFFLDSTLGPKINCLVLVTLMVVLMLFYTLFTVIDEVFFRFDGDWLVNSFIVILVASALCRFRD
mmetsp:Transcript_24864/g.30564  ORF Transcript_24864/g.30564 Transcript_24864/m.30564 type:complete len:318 (+) Transcript_24864:116-1069(+)